jgi:hypothetical protein
LKSNYDFFAIFGCLTEFFAMETCIKSGFSYSRSSDLESDGLSFWVSR